MASDVRWFSWGTALAVVDGDRAFSIGRDDWLPVNEADVTWDGRPLSEPEARSGFADLLSRAGEPPTTASQSAPRRARGTAQ